MSLVVHIGAVTAVLLASSISSESRINLDVEYNEALQKDILPQILKEGTRPSEKLKNSFKKKSKQVSNQNLARGIKLDSAQVSAEVETSKSQTATVQFSNYLRSIISLINQKRSYPLNAQRRGHQGQVILRLQLKRSGEVISVEIINPSAYPELNEAAVSTIKQISKYPEIPAELLGATIILKIPINYRIQN